MWYQDLVYKQIMMEQHELPPGWSMPESMANRVSNAVSKKPITPKDKLQKALDEMARDIAIIEPKPSEWELWVAYLLEQLENHADKHRRVYNYKQALVVLVEKIQNRIKGGKW